MPSVKKYFLFQPGKFDHHIRTGGFLRDLFSCVRSHERGGKMDTVLRKEHLVHSNAAASRFLFSIPPDDIKIFPYPVADHHLGLLVSIQDALQFIRNLLRRNHGKIKLLPRHFFFFCPYTACQKKRKSQAQCKKPDKPFFQCCCRLVLSSFQHMQDGKLL